MGQSHSDPAASFSASHATETSLRLETSAVACSGGVDTEVTEACTPSTEACSASTSGSSSAAEPRKVSMPSRTGVELGVELLDAVFDNVHVAEVLNRRVERDAVLAEAGGVVVGTGESDERQRQDKRSDPAHGQFLLRDDRHHPTRGQRCHHPVRTIRGFDPGGVHQSQGGSIGPHRSVRSQACPARIHLNRVTTADGVGAHRGWGDSRGNRRARHRRGPRSPIRV